MLKESLLLGSIFDVQGVLRGPSLTGVVKAPNLLSGDCMSFIITPAIHEVPSSLLKYLSVFEETARKLHHILQDGKSLLEVCESARSLFLTRPNPRLRESESAVDSTVTSEDNDKYARKASRWSRWCIKSTRCSGRRCQSC